MKGGFKAEEARRKDKATIIALLEFLLEQGADTEREGDPILPILRAWKADPDVPELGERNSGNNRKVESGGMVGETLNSAAFRRTALVEH